MINVMTTSRVIRGTRAKIFLYVCAVLILTGIIACYNNTLSQLDDVRRSNDICHQQEENLSTQLQGISEYKQRLEKSLKTEKAEHQQTKNDLKKLTQESNKFEKESSDMKLKLSSLQQNYNLLETQYGDYKEECSKKQQKQQKQLEDINDLQSKLKEVKEELKKVQSAKESLKSQYLKLQIEKDNLENQLNDIQVNKNDNESNINHLNKELFQLRTEYDDLKRKCPSYETLQDPIQVVELPSQKTPPKVSEVTPSSSYVSNNSKLADANVINIPQAEKQERSVLAVPNQEDSKSNSKSSTKSGLKPSQASLNGARPLLVPTVTPETANKNKVVLGVSDPNKDKLPEGVVAIPKTKNENQNEPELVDNRYRIAKESINEPNDNKAGKEDIDKENGAHEVFDAPLAQNNFEELAFGDNDHLKQADKKSDKNHIDNLGVNDKKVYDQDQPNDYKELQNDAQLEEEDDDDYADNNLGRQGAAIRN